MNKVTRLILLLCSCWLPVPAFAATLLSGFSETQVATGISNATAMALSPDGRIFICQQGGALRVIKNDVLLATSFVDLSVNASGERGLLGVAFDPNFNLNGYVYVFYTTSTEPIHNRVSRFTASGDVALPGSEVVLVDLDNLNATNHNGGAIHFGPDGKLYIAVGENANPSDAQTLANRHGKILRLNADGTIPTDNPFYNTASGANRSIWALGLRNPFTFAFQPGSGRMLINDVGAVTWEEINDGIAGSNYGWPDSEGPTNDAGTRAPIFAYEHGSGNTRGFAITGGAFYNPATPQYPASYTGKYFFADYVNDWIRLLDPVTNTATLFATNTNGPVDLQVGANGSLYYLSRNDGRLMRVRYSPAPAIAFNISARARVELGDNVLIGGFIILGDAYKKVVVRGLGPSLEPFVADPLSDPVLELYNSSGVVIAGNDNWTSNQVEVEGTGLAPMSAFEAVIVATLPPGSYTGIVRGKAGETGVGQVEIFDGGQSAEARLANISGRSLVLTEDDVMIAGFILEGSNQPAHVVVRGIGPSLNVPGELADPTLEVRNGNGALIAFNDDWQNDPAQASQLTAADLDPLDPAEAAVILNQMPGSYTAILRGKNSTTGIGLVEVFIIP